MIRQSIKRALALTGLEVRRKGSYDYEVVAPVEFSKADLEVLQFVTEQRFTMGSRERVVATINACKHAVQAEIAGDFVECGVWRGGNSIAAKLTFENYGSDKKVWLFDTFTGMTPPTEHDTTRFSDKSAAERFDEAQAGGHNEWCFASLGDVQANFKSAGADMAGVRFIAGDVMKTLADQHNLPEALCVLRLDTDFYDSTKAELETLYPRLSAGGSLLIDDFGHWDGARRAVEEYLGALPPRSRPLLHYTDYSGRMAIKV
jgi:O-methyltransferase